MSAACQSVLIAHTAFTKSGPDPFGKAGVRNSLEIETKAPISAGREAIASTIVRALSPDVDGRFDPAAIRARLFLCIGTFACAKLPIPIASDLLCLRSCLTTRTCKDLWRILFEGTN